MLGGGMEGGGGVWTITVVSVWRCSSGFTSPSAVAAASKGKSVRKEDVRKRREGQTEERTFSLTDVLDTIDSPRTTRQCSWWEETVTSQYAVHRL